MVTTRPHTGRPILVTGTHRSGTTWVGKILSLSGEAESIHEPFNPNMYSSWMSQPPERWFWHVDPHDDGPVRDDMSRVLQFRPAFLPMLRRGRSPRAVAGAAREQLTAARARFHRRRPLLKDPIAFFAAEWLAQQFDAKPLVLVRHPAAFASSLKRLDWQFDFANLWEQPGLVARYLHPFRHELRRASAAELDIIDQSILVWRLLNHVTLTYCELHPDWIIRRYEDLASDPQTEFQNLYGLLDLRWSPGVAEEIHALTARGNGAAVADGDRGGVRRHSQAAMWTWTHRLTELEIERVRAGTEDVARAWYADEDWWPPRTSERATVR